MSEAVRAMLSGIRTVEDMIAAFSDEQQCRRLFEGMIPARAGNSQTPLVARTARAAIAKSSSGCNRSPNASNP